MNKNKIQKLLELEIRAMKEIRSLQEQAQEIHNSTVLEEQKLQAVHIISLCISHNLPYETIPEITNSLKVLKERGEHFESYKGMEWTIVRVGEFL